MKKNHFTILAMIVAIIPLMSCYTMIRLPQRSSSELDVTNGEIMQEEELIPMTLNPSIPEGCRDNYDWLYYYQSAWWLDNLQPALMTGTTDRPEPEEYRRRFPQGNQAIDGTVTAPSATYGIPSLSKASENTPAPPADTDPKNLQRRDFNSGSHPNTSSATQSAVSSDSSSRRDFEAGSHTNKNDADNSTKKRK